MHIITEVQFRRFDSWRLFSAMLISRRQSVDLHGRLWANIKIGFLFLNNGELTWISVCPTKPPPSTTQRRKTTGSYRNVVLLIKKEQRTALTLFLLAAFSVVLLLQRCSSSRGGGRQWLLGMGGGWGSNDVTIHGP